MSINKERLEELIKQGESAPIFCTVWNSDYGEVVLDDKSEICYGYYDKEHKKIANTFLYALTLYDNEYHDICLEDTDFFETEEEMDWYLEFGEIQRTETLSLPSWEEVNKQNSWVFRFVDADGDRCKIEGYYNPNLRSGFIDVVKAGTGMTDLPEYNKENYIKACRLAKKLFLGEETQNG